MNQEEKILDEIKQLLPDCITYMQHLRLCRAINSPRGECDCGLVETHRRTLVALGHLIDMEGK